MFKLLETCSQNAVIKVIGVGGGGGNAVQHMTVANIDGVDFSEEMLKISRKRNIYQKLWQQDFTTPAKLSDLYEALICVGMFSYSIPKIEHMHHVVDCVVPGGLCVITVNGAAWQDLDLGAEVENELHRHNYSLVCNETAGYIENEGIDSRVSV